MSNIGIKPLGTRVVVNPIEAETVTSGGLIIPDSAQEKQAKGVIVATASGTESTPMDVKVGDKVLYGKFAGTEIKHQGKDLIIMEQADILAII